MSSVLFTSDLHLFHPKVAEIRGFASVEDHNAAVADRWRDTVGPRDKVHVVGDVTGDSRSIGKTIALLNSLPGEKHLIAGNHDAVHPLNRNAHRHMDDYRMAFASVQSAGRVKIAGHDVLLSHFPYVRDRGETRYAQWRLPNLGAWLIHGHTHGTEKVTYYGHPWAGSREIHVGLDAWDLTPVHVDTVAALIKEHTP